MHFLSTAVHVCALGTLTWLAVVDVRTRRLPNRAVLLVGLMYFLDALLSGQSLHQVAGHCAAALIAFVLGVVLYALRAFGAGDVKLGAMVFLWSGLDLSIATLMLISIAGMVVGLISYSTRSLDSESASGWKKALANFSDVRGVPYGVALAIGGGVVIARTSTF